MINYVGDGGKKGNNHCDIENFFIPYWQLVIGSRVLYVFTMYYSISRIYNEIFIISIISLFNSYSVADLRWGKGPGPSVNFLTYKTNGIPGSVIVIV